MKRQRLDPRRARVEGRTVFAVMVAILLVATTALAHPFSFKIPPGFVDLGHMTISERNMVPSSILSAKVGYDVYAVKLDGGRVLGQFMVKVGAGGTPIRVLVQDLFTGMPKDPRLAKGKFLAHEIVTLHGVECGVIEREDVLNGAKLHQLMYILPGGKDTAWLKLVAPPEHFDEVRGPFELAVRGVGGVSAPTPSSGRSPPFVFIVAALAFGVGTVGWLVRRRRSARRPRARSSKQRRDH
jgi:hypothetical protein